MHPADAHAGGQAGRVEDPGGRVQHPVVDALLLRPLRFGIRIFEVERQHPRED